MISGFPQRSILGPLLYKIYTADLPHSDKTILSTFADDTAIFTTHPDLVQASANLQDHLYETDNWTQKWKLKINKTKSSHITFTLRRGQCPPPPPCASTRQSYLKWRRLNTSDYTSTDASPGRTTWQRNGRNLTKKHVR
jgi:hypothetical protein